MTWGGKGRFTSKRDAMSRAKKAHMCTSCLYSQPQTFKACPSCQVTGSRVYFPSSAELARAASLILLQRAGAIRELRFHPRVDLIVEGTKICAYEADACYIENGRQIYEDTKPEGDFVDATAALKIALFDALHAKHGIKVKIVRSS